VRTGSSYLSQSELPVTLGLGDRTTLDELIVEWPSGGRDTVRSLTAGTAYTIGEGKGVTAQRKLGSPRGSG
jgi:hypothetical protein